MDKYTVTINSEYFAKLGSQFRGTFDDVSKAMLYAENAQKSCTFNFLFPALRRVVNEYRGSLEYDITCISSVFATQDEDMKRRAEQLIGKDIIDIVGNGGTITREYDEIKPILKEPRKLTHTQYGYTTDADGNQVYDHPVETENYLYRNQGDAYALYQGTCGLCSCANILRLAGVNATEKEIVDYATEHDLCHEGSKDPGQNGGTGADDREKILEHYGISCHTESVPLGSNGVASKNTINNIAQYVEEGKGVNISVEVSRLGSYRSQSGYHSIIVTSVKKDSSGNILGFYVCDSNSGKPSYYDAGTIQKSLSGNPMLVTDNPIR